MKVTKVKTVGMWSAAFGKGSLKAVLAAWVLTAGVMSPSHAHAAWASPWKAGALQQQLETEQIKANQNYWRAKRELYMAQVRQNHLRLALASSLALGLASVVVMLYRHKTSRVK
jgi:hypothetical protein